MSENRVYNFSAGPSMLPEDVLFKARDEMLNYHASGMSVMEMSHRSKVFEEIIFGAQSLARSILGIPNNYKVLFMQGGATLQFAMAPMNLLTGSGIADYVCTGQFSEKAYKEAQLFGKTINLAATTKNENYTRIPGQDELNLDPDADYLHICFNNTIFGTKWQYVPETGKVPIVADMSSCIMSEPVDVTKFGLIYAGAQKNLAPAGLTLVIIRDDLIGEPLPGTPTMMNYALMAKNDSLLNTPPAYPIYIFKLVMEWIQQLGGLEAMHRINRAKADELYAFIDESALFKSAVNKSDRSMMNVVFKTGSDELDAKFVKDAAAAGFVNIKGHRSVGGMRASIYNAMPPEGITKLVDFMKKFEKDNG